MREDLTNNQTVNDIRIRFIIKTAVRKLYYASSNSRYRDESPIAIMLLIILAKMVENKIGLFENPETFINIDRGLPIRGQVLNLTKEDMSTLLREPFISEKVKYTFQNALDLIEESKGLTFVQFDELIRIDGDTLFMCLVGEVSNRRSSLSFFELVCAILDLKDEESFCDLSCGNGTSTAIIAKKAKSSDITLSDLSLNEKAMAECMKFLCGLNNVKIDETNREFFNKKYDKIFVNLQMEPRLDNQEMVGQIYTLDASEAALLKATTLLKPNGRAAIAMFASFLFGSNSAQEIRKYLISHMLIKAVILLPSMSRLTAVKTALVILEHNSKNTIFIDLTTEEFADYENIKKTRTLTTETIEHVMNILANNDVNTNYSASISNLEIENNSYLLVPSTYIKKEKKHGRPIFEIDTDIDSILNNIRIRIDELVN